MKITANGPGIGDAVFLTAVAYEYYKATSQPLTVCAYYPELYENNPTISTVGSDEPAVTFPELHDQGAIKEHNVAFMCRKLGLPVPAYQDIRQYIYLTQDEQRSYPPNTFDVTIHVGTGPWTTNKDWGFSNWQELVNLLPMVTFTQVGGEHEPRLAGYNVHHMLGHTLRKTATVIANARLHLSGVTGTMHMASGVGTRCLTIFGGRENPLITGYANNINITNNPAQNCAPCWKVEPCPYNRPCLSAITPNQIKDFIWATV